MPRIARAVAAGYPHHVIQRGNNKEAVFSDEEDRRRYMALLTKYSIKWDVSRKRAWSPEKSNCPPATTRVNLLRKAVESAL